MSKVIPQVLIPIPYELASLILMGIGVFFWLFIVIDLVGWMHTRYKRKDVTEVRDRTMEDFWSSKLKERFGSYLIMFLLGLGFFLFGYLIYSGFVWDLFSTAYFPFILLAALALLTIIFVFSRRDKT